MAKKKTEYRFIVNADPAAINQVMNNFLSAHEFSPVAKPGANYFLCNDFMRGNHCLEYYINGNEVVILAYMGSFERPQALEGFVGAVPKNSYKKELDVLFQELQRLNMQGGMYQQMNGAPQQMNMAGVMPQQNGNVFTEQSDKRKENWAIAGFVISIIGLLLSFIGFTYGAFILILEFYCASQGLKTKKRGLAIATIVIACVSLVIVLAEMIFIFLYA